MSGGGMVFGSGVCTTVDMGHWLWVTDGLWVLRYSLLVVNDIRAFLYKKKKR